MSLKFQLALVSLLMVVLPWAGYHYTNDVASAMRTGLQQSLLAQSHAIQNRLQSEPILNQYSQIAKRDYIPSLDVAPVVDGYEDWLGKVYKDRATANSLMLAVSKQTLFGLIKVHDSRIDYHNPSSGRLANGDAIAFESNNQRYILRTSAPGEVYWLDTETRKRAYRARAHWLETTTGFLVEFAIPLEAFSSLSFDVNDYSQTPALQSRFSLDKVYFYTSQLESLLHGFAQAGQTLQLLDRDGFLLAEQRGAPISVEQKSHGLMVWLYKRLLQQPSQLALPQSTQLGNVHIQNAESTWFSVGNNALARVQQTIEIDGQKYFLVLNQSSEALTELTSSAFSRLFWYTFLSVAFALGLLLAYASWLSLRIRRLSIAANLAVQDDGKLNVNLPNIKAGDEIGELARNFQTLLTRVEDYNQYLRSLADKLSHELRTPIAVINGSLENLAATQTNDSANLYVQRALDASSRLSSTLMAMSAAKRLEDSLDTAMVDAVPLHDLLNEMSAVYQQTYTTHRFSCEADQVTLELADELIVQMLDKLIDNAVSFCPENGEISLSLSREGSVARLLISNDGPLLSESIKHQLFNSLVSQREGSTDELHMGLGLAIVKLICDFHKASVVARNRADGGGVEFVISFPLERG